MRILSSYQVAFNLLYKNHQGIKKHEVAREAKLFESALCENCISPFISKSNYDDLISALNDYTFCFIKNEKEKTYSLKQKYNNKKSYEEINSDIDLDIYKAIEIYINKKDIAH